MSADRYFSKISEDGGNASLLPHGRSKFPDDGELCQQTLDQQGRLDFGLLQQASAGAAATRPDATPSFSHLTFVYFDGPERAPVHSGGPRGGCCRRIRLSEQLDADLMGIGCLQAPASAAECALPLTAERVTGSRFKCVQER